MVEVEAMSVKRDEWFFGESRSRVREFVGGRQRHCHPGPKLPGKSLCGRRTHINKTHTFSSFTRSLLPFTYIHIDFVFISHLTIPRYKLSFPIHNPNSFLLLIGIHLLVDITRASLKNYNILLVKLWATVYVLLLKLIPPRALILLLVLLFLFISFVFPWILIFGYFSLVYVVMALQFWFSFSFCLFVYIVFSICICVWCDRKWIVLIFMFTVKF